MASPNDVMGSKNSNSFLQSPLGTALIGLLSGGAGAAAGYYAGGGGGAGGGGFSNNRNGPRGAVNASSGGSVGTQGISGHDLKQIPNFTPQMMKLFESLLGNANKNAPGALNQLSGLASGKGPQFEQMEAPAYEAFNKTLGQLGSRFSQFGAQDSSAFQNALSGAGRNLALDLQSQRSQISRDAIDKLLGYSQSLLGQRPYENVLEQDNSGIDWGDLIAKLGPAAIQLIAAFI